MAFVFGAVVQALFVVNVLVLNTWVVATSSESVSSPSTPGLTWQTVPNPEFFAKVDTPQHKAQENGDDCKTTISNGPITDFSKRNVYGVNPFVFAHAPISAVKHERNADSSSSEKVPIGQKALSWRQQRIGSRSAGPFPGMQWFPQNQFYDMQFGQNQNGLPPNSKVQLGQLTRPLMPGFPPGMVPVFVMQPPMMYPGQFPGMPYGQQGLTGAPAPGYWPYFGSNFYQWPPLYYPMGQQVTLAGYPYYFNYQLPGNPSSLLLMQPVVSGSSDVPNVNSKPVSDDINIVSPDEALAALVDDISTAGDSQNLIAVGKPTEPVFVISENNGQGSEAATLIQDVATTVVNSQGTVDANQGSFHGAATGGNLLDLAVSLIPPVAVTTAAAVSSEGSTLDQSSGLATLLGHGQLDIDHGIFDGVPEVASPGSDISVASDEIGSDSTGNGFGISLNFDSSGIGLSGSGNVATLFGSSDQSTSGSASGFSNSENIASSSSQYSASSSYQSSSTLQSQSQSVSPASISSTGILSSPV